MYHQCLTSVLAVFRQFSPVFEKVSDDAKDILEKVSDDGDDIFEKVSDDAKDILVTLKHCFKVSNVSPVSH